MPITGTIKIFLSSDTLRDLAIGEKAYISIMDLFVFRKWLCVPLDAELSYESDFEDTGDPEDDSCFGEMFIQVKRISRELAPDSFELNFNIWRGEYMEILILNREFNLFKFTEDENFLCYESPPIKIISDEDLTEDGSNGEEWKRLTDSNEASSPKIDSCQGTPPQEESTLNLKN